MPPFPRPPANRPRPPPRLRVPAPPGRAGMTCLIPRRRRRRRSGGEQAAAANIPRRSCSVPRRSSPPMIGALVVQHEFRVANMNSESPGKPVASESPDMPSCPGRHASAAPAKRPCEGGGERQRAPVCPRASGSTRMQTPGSSRPVPGCGCTWVTSHAPRDCRVTAPRSHGPTAPLAGGSSRARQPSSLRPGRACVSARRTVSESRRIRVLYAPRLGC